MLWITWTIRLCLVAYALALAGWIRAEARPVGAAVRCAWTAACALLIVHVLCAFHLEHDWSHELAVIATRRDTLETVGVDWGGGVWINYALLLVWSADVAWWWISPESYHRRHALLTISVHVFIAFMALNGAALFETGFVRYSTIAMTIALIAMWSQFRKGRT